MTFIKPQKQFKNNSGFVLILMVILSTLLLIIATSAVILTIREYKIASNIEVSAQSYAAAESGIERALACLYQDPNCATACTSTCTIPPTTEPDPDGNGYTDIGNAAEYRAEINQSATPKTITSTGRYKNFLRKIEIQSQ